MILTTGQVWAQLLKATDSPNLTAAIMGNLFAESALNSNNLQGVYEKKFGLTDEQYTARVDRGEISREQFSQDHAGYGYAQWTYWSRKQGLYDFIKQHPGTPSISEGTLQLEYVIEELTNNYKHIWNKRATASLNELCDDILKYYEAPASKDDPETILKRRRFAQQFYEEFYKPELKAIRYIEEALEDAYRLVQDYQCDLNNNLTAIKKKLDELKEILREDE